MSLGTTTRVVATGAFLGPEEMHDHGWSPLSPSGLAGLYGALAVELAHADVALRVERYLDATGGAGRGGPTRFQVTRAWGCFRRHEATPVAPACPPDTVLCRVLLNA